MVTWMMNGPASDPDEFAIQRLQEIPNAKGYSDTSFWYMEIGGGLHLKPAVVQKLAYLRDVCLGRGAFEKLVESIHNLLAVRPEDRPTANALCSELEMINLQAEADLSKDADYYLSGSWKRRAWVMQEAVLSSRLLPSQLRQSHPFGSAADNGNAICNESNAATQKARWSFPFGRNARFAGYESELNELKEKILVQGCCSRFAISGLGGVGKTQIALEFAYRLRDVQPERFVFWVPAINNESFEKAFLGIGRLLQIPNLEEQNADVKRLVQQRLSQESTGSWLLIIDNADDINMWFKDTGNKIESTSLIDYLPTSGRGSTIFTTRSRKAAVKLAQQNVIEVPQMDQNDATQVLRNAIINQEILNDHEITRKLLNRLTFLPLAIVQAATYINENAITLSQYLSLFEDREQDLVDTLSEDFEDEGRYRHPDLKNPIATTWCISFERIRLHDPLAADFLSFMSCIDPKVIPRSLLPPARSSKKMTDAIGTLSAYSFIKSQRDDQSLDLHPLVHLATRNWLREQNSLLEWTAKVITRLAEVFSSKNYKGTEWKLYLPHARYIVSSDLVYVGAEERLSLLQILGQYLHVDGDGSYIEAKIPLKQVMETTSRVLAQEPPDTLTSMANLALTYGNQGRWQEAEELVVQVIETLSRVLVRKHPDTLISMNNLASTYDETEKLYQRALAENKKKLGLEHSDTPETMKNLTDIYTRQGRYDEAKKLYQRALTGRKEQLGPKHLDTLRTVDNLADVYRSKGRYDEAEKLYQWALTERKKQLGPKHPHTLRTVENLANVYISKGRYDEVEGLYQRALVGNQKKLGPKHPDTLRTVD